MPHSKPKPKPIKPREQPKPYVVSEHRDFIGRPSYAVCRDGDDWKNTVMLAERFSVAMAEARRLNGNARTPKSVPYNPDIPPSNPPINR